MENNLQSLKKLVSAVLGQAYFDDLCQFFMDIFSESDKQIVFITRRCFCLGYLFLQMLQEENSDWKPMCRSFLTDSALIDSGFSIGAGLPDNRAPEILLVDDSIAYGRAARSVLEGLFARVTEGFHSVGGDPSCQEYLSPLQYVQKKVEISVFAKKKQRLVLPSFYQRNVYFVKSYNNADWNEFSNRLSELVNVSNLANTAFVLSVGADCEPKETERDGWTQIKTVYRKLEQKAWFKPLPSREHPTAICSVRRVQSGIENRYRYIPFVFLPTLSNEKLVILESRVFDRIEKSGDLELQADCRVVRKLQEDTTPRRRMEFITMYLSHSVLLSFADEFKLALADNCFDIDKLACNYTTTADIDGAAKRLLHDLCQTRYRSSLLSKDELCAWAELFPDDLVCGGTATLELCKCSEQDQTAVRECLENYLYDLGIRAEKRAHACIVQSSSPGEATLDSLNEVRYDTLFSFIGKLQENLGRSDNLACLMAWVLQMMDCGAMSIVISDGHGCAEQQIRVCEQALFLLPRRHAHCMDALRALDRYASYPMEKKYAQIECFVSFVYQNSEKPQVRGEELGRLLCQMRESAQAIEDWDVRLDRHFIIDSVTGLASWDDAEENQLQKLREEYAQMWVDSQAHNKRGSTAREKNTSEFELMASS